MRTALTAWDLRARIPRVMIADRWDFFTLVAGSSIQ